jgi:hypothetical protein
MSVDAGVGFDVDLAVNEKRTLIGTDALPEAHRFRSLVYRRSTINRVRLIWSCSVSTCLRPEGQSTSIRSIVSASPNPKYSGSALCER